MRVNHREDELENHDRGLDYDLPRLLHRRGMLKLVAGVALAGTGLFTLGACADNTSGTSTGSANGLGGAPTGAGGPPGGAPEGQETSDTANGELPEETSGPYPGDGSNGPNLLAESGIVRSDITTSLDSARPRRRACPFTSQ